MATSALRVVIPTIFVLILLMIGISIYRGGGDEKDKDEDNQNRNWTLEPYSVQNGSDVPVTTEKEDVENINQALKAIRDRLAQYGDIIDEDEFMGAIIRECEISADADGNCDEELYDKNEATGCCVPKNPEMMSDEELADLADRMGQDATFSCLEGVEPDDTGSCGNNARFDYEQECCIRSCVVYPSIESSGEPVCDNPVYPNLVDGCCDISSKEAENRAKEAQKQKKEMMLQMAAMVLGDQVITNLIPRMAQIMLNYTESTGKGKAAKAARETARIRATTAADARGLKGDTKTRFVNWEMDRTFNKAMSKDTQFINEFSRTVNKVRADQVAGKPASRTIFTKGLVRASTKFAGKVASKLAIILLRMLVKLNSGPLGWAMMVFDIFSLMLDLGDAGATVTYLEQGDMFDLRNKLMYEMYFKMKKDGLDYPMMYPINFAFPEEHDLAQNALTTRLAEDTMNRVLKDPIFDTVEQRRVNGEELTSGESERYEQVVKTVNLFCKFILLGMSQYGAANADGGDFKDIDLFSLSDEENLTIDRETFITFEESTFEYIQFYFARMVQELNIHTQNPIEKYPGMLGNATSDDDVEEAIVNGKSFCGNIDPGSPGVGLRPNADMIKLVPQMVNLDYNHYKRANMGISLTAKGVAYINRPEQKHTWYKFNSVFIDPYAEDAQNNSMWIPHGTDKNSAKFAKYSGTYAASYGTKALTIDPNEFVYGSDGEITSPRLLPETDRQGYPQTRYLTQKKRLNPEEDLTENVAWISPLVPLIAMCEGPRGMQNELGFKPMRQPCNISNTVLNINTGVCMFTKELCENYLRPEVEDKYDDATETYYKDCTTSDTQEGLSYVLGDQIAGRWGVQAANVNEASDAFADNPNFDTFGDAFLQTVGFWPLMAASMIEDTHEYNKERSSSPTEAAIRTGTDPFGLQMFFKTMAAKFKGKPRFCIPENMLYLGSPADECKLFRVRNTADIFTNPTIHYMLRVAIFRHNPETGGEDPYPTHSTNFQNEIKHNEDYEFFIPAARPATEVNGIQIPAVPAGYVVISLSEDMFTDLGGDIPGFENKSSNCVKSRIITYDEIIPGKEYGVRAPNGCIEFGDRSDTQREADNFFTQAYNEFADGKECVEDAIYTGVLPWLETAGNEVWDGLKDSRNAWKTGLTTAADYAKDSGLAYKVVGEEVKTLFENPKDSKIIDFFGNIDDNLEDAGEWVEDIFDPGNWKPSWKSPF